MYFDYLIVGSGLFGATFAERAVAHGKKCLVIEKRDHIGGNIYTEKVADIDVHRYGAHIFHTGNRAVWDYVNRFAEFNGFINTPVANYRGEIYNLPFNMNTFAQMFHIATPDEASAELERQRAEVTGTPSNLEEQAIRLVGRDIYTKLIKGYTEKQWGRDCKDLPPFIIRRLPVRMTYDNNYFNDRFQGIPEDGYTAMIEKMLAGAEVRLNTDFFDDRDGWMKQADKVVYTGAIDAFFDYCFGALEYRSLRFETEVLDRENYQGSAVVNYTDRTPEYTRIIEHKHFNFGKQPKTVITKEYPTEWKPGMEPYYPINDARNTDLYERYRAEAEKLPNVLFGGRLGLYRYFDMDKVIEAALELCRRELGDA